MEKFRLKHSRLIENTALDFQRYLLSQLPWEEKLVGLKGSRGVGKSTLLLQYIKQRYGQSTTALYISLDDLYFSENTLTRLAEDFAAKGGTHLFVDEVHKYPNWAVELKNIYDGLPGLRVVFTGSSLLEILNARADLSRRALVYSLQGLSFREYLNLNLNIDLKAYTLKDILDNHLDIALEISNKLKPLQHFEGYLRTGYFPFYKGKEVIYYKQLQEIINMIIEIELPQLRGTGTALIPKIKQLIFILSQSVPFKPNASALANKIKISRKTLLEYFNYLSDAQVFNALYKEAHGISLLQKPEKLFLENSNYLYAIKQDAPNTGSLRETFFYNQVKQGHQVTYPDRGDFCVDGKYYFEVGGKSKRGGQLSGATLGYVAADGIELGYDRKIPLWLFGFLY